MLFLCSERDVFANFGKHLRGDAEERGNGMERQVLHDAGTTLQQQLVTLAGRGTVEVEVALVALPQHVLGDDAAQLHLRRVLTEKNVSCSLLMRNTRLFSIASIDDCDGRPSRQLG